MISLQSVAQLSNAAVLSETKRLAFAEQAATADLVAMLAELDSRKQENYQEVLQSARHQRKKNVELMIARLRPKPDVPPVVRKLPSPARSENRDVLVYDQKEASDSPSVPARPVAATAARPIVAPLAPERFKIQFTADQEAHELLRRAQALLRHRLPSGDLPTVFKLALKSLVSELERKKAGIVAKPRSSGRVSPKGSRYISRDVRRAVWTRDEAQCVFEGPRGRCNERDFLQFHHLRPFADGGEASVENLELRCRAHNAYEADLFLSG